MKSSMNKKIFIGDSMESLVFFYRSRLYAPLIREGKKNSLSAFSSSPQVYSYMTCLNEPIYMKILSFHFRKFQHEYYGYENFHFR